MAQLIVANQATSILENPNVQLALILGGAGLAYWWFFVAESDPCATLQFGPLGDLPSELCDTAENTAKDLLDVAKEAPGDALEIASNLPGRWDSAGSGSAYDKAQVALDLEESDNMFDKVSTAIVDAFTGDSLKKAAEIAREMDNISIEHTQPYPEVTKRALGKWYDWIISLKNPFWLNNSAFANSTINRTANFDMELDAMAENLRNQTNGELRLIETEGEYDYKGGRKFFLSAQTDDGRWVKIADADNGLQSGWYGLVKQYWEEENPGQLWNEQQWIIQQQYILKLYGAASGTRWPVIMWGSGQSYIKLAEWYRLTYDEEKGILVDALGTGAYTGR